MIELSTEATGRTRGVLASVVPFVVEVVTVREVSEGGEAMGAQLMHRQSGRTTKTAAGLALTRFVVLARQRKKYKWVEALQKPNHARVIIFILMPEPLLRAPRSRCCIRHTSRPTVFTNSSLCYESLSTRPFHPCSRLSRVLVIRAAIWSLYLCI